MQLLFLVPVALATTATREATLASPVQKVVKLLEDMKLELEQEAEKDKENYEKLACWCETNDKAKTEAIAAAKSRIEELEAETEQREGRDKKLTQSIEQGTAEIAELKNSLQGAEKQRAKESEENQDTMVELTKNVASLKAAIIVLKKHQETEFPQLKAVKPRRMSFLQGALSPADKLARWMDQNKYASLSSDEQSAVERSVDHYVKQVPHGEFTDEEAATLNDAQRLLQNFLQGSEGYTPKYEPQSGEIFGILTQLKEQLEEDLKDTQDKDAKQAQQFTELSDGLQQQIAQAEKLLDAQTQEAGANSKALAEAKEELVATQDQLEVDTKFLRQLKKMCGNLDKDWEARSKTRDDEMAAVSEALSMLVSDDAKDTFAGDTPNSTVPSGGVQAFVQLDSSRLRAAAVLVAAGRKARSPQLQLLAESVQLDKFTKVKKAINDMIGALKQQQEDEVKHKKFCQTELQKIDMETMDKENTKKDLETSIETLENAIETLGGEIDAALAEVADTKVNVQKANINRVEESQEFQKEVENQRAVRGILSKVKGRLNEFYAQALLQQPADPSVPVMPGSLGEYKKNAGASPVIAMLDNLIGDAMKAEMEAIKTENDAVSEYQQFITDSNDALAKLEITITDKKQLKAESEKDLEGATSDLRDTVDDLGALAKREADTHKACDFVLKNFDIRQQARSDEIEAMQQALAILSGA